MEDYHTHYLGKTKDGKLFWGYQTFVYPENSDFQNAYVISSRKDYAVLHLFDGDGNYLESKYQSQRPLEESILYEPSLGKSDYLEDEVGKLGEVEYGNIEIKLFATQIDGITFGLIADKEGECINLYPSKTIAFYEPWNGEYYT